MPKDTRTSGGRTEELITIEEYNTLRYEEKARCPDCKGIVIPKTKAGSYESPKSVSGRVNGMVHHFEHEPGSLKNPATAACPNNHLNKGKITEVWALVKNNVFTTFK